MALLASNNRQGGNDYGWTVVKPDQRAKVLFSSSTNTHIWILTVTSSWDNGIAHPCNQASAMFRSAPPLIRKALGLFSARGFVSRFNDPAKFPLVEAVLDKATDLFGSQNDWGGYLNDADWQRIFNEAVQAGLPNGAYVFVPQQGEKRQKPSARLEPTFEWQIKTSIGNLNLTEFRWIPRKSRRRMAEAWIRIRQSKQDCHQSPSRSSTQDTIS